MRELKNYMQITSTKISNVNYVQIYLTEEELKEQKTKEVIEKYKVEKCNVAIFQLGKQNYPEILQKIIAEQAELSDNVC